jgi:cell division septum initiation protein DivIVA
MNNSGKDGVVTLGGREFRRAKSGLDEAEVASFIDELIRERDRLAQSQHHIGSLTKLAETTIVEADRLASQIKMEATQQAKAESAALIDKAREQARQTVEKKQAEVLKTAHEDADAIRMEAEKKAAALLENETTKIQGALRGVIGKQFGYLLEELDRLRKQAAAAKADFESKPLPIAKETRAIGEIPVEQREPVVARSQQAGGTAVIAAQEEPSAPPVKEGKALDQSLYPSQATHQPEKGFDLSRLLEMEDRSDLGEPHFEVEILPPVHMRKMMEVVAYLDELPEVENTEIIPRVDMPAILVFLRKETNLLSVLRTIPGVTHVEEVTTGTDASNGDVGKGPKKVRIGLSSNTLLQEKP